MADPDNILFIGTGNMGGAILKGLVKTGYPVHKINFYEPSDTTATQLIAETGALRQKDLIQGIGLAQTIFLAIKPQVFPAISAEIQGKLNTATVIVSVMAGINSEKLRTLLGTNLICVRTMPNIPMIYSQGTVAIAIDNQTEALLSKIESLFRPVAKTVRVTESQMDAVTGLSGSGPAFVFQFLDGLIQGGIKAGLNYDTARELTLATVAGSTAMAQISGQALSELTSKVTSPGGTTIYGLHQLEASRFKSAIMNAVEAAANRSRELGN
jgi:pyrroline-5-carboxylate reductase